MLILPSGSNGNLGFYDYYQSLVYRLLQRLKNASCLCCLNISRKSASSIAVQYKGWSSSFWALWSGEWVRLLHLLILATSYLSFKLTRNQRRLNPSLLDLYLQLLRVMETSFCLSIWYFHFYTFAWCIFCPNLDINLVDHRPSTIAAAAVLAASNQTLNKQLVESKLSIFSSCGGALESVSWSSTVAI